MRKIIICSILFALPTAAAAAENPKVVQYQEAYSCAYQKIESGVNRQDDDPKDLAKSCLGSPSDASSEQLRGYRDAIANYSLRHRSSQPPPKRTQSTNNNSHPPSEEDAYLIRQLEDTQSQIETGKSNTECTAEDRKVYKRMMSLVAHGHEQGATEDEVATAAQQAQVIKKRCNL
jgi:hypothetical protein